MDLRKVALGILSTTNDTSVPLSSGKSLKSASSVARSTRQPTAPDPEASFATSTVGKQRCVRVEEAGRSDVYCLNVPSTAAFCIEGGFLVHNSADELRYAMMHVYKPSLPKLDAVRNPFFGGNVLSSLKARKRA